MAMPYMQTEMPKYVRIDDEVSKLTGKLNRDVDLVTMLSDESMDFRLKIAAIANKLRSQFGVQDPLKLLAVTHRMNDLYQFAPTCPHHQLEQHERDPRLYRASCFNLDTICTGFFDHKKCAVYLEQEDLARAARYGSKKHT